MQTTIRKEKSKVISLFAITLFCLLLGFKAGAFIFGFLAVLKGVRYYQDPNRLLKDRIVNDARRWDVEVPNSYSIKKKLFNLYRGIQKKERSEPIFISSFSFVLDEFWKQAGSFRSERDWVENLVYLDRNIPGIKHDRNTLSEALSDMQNLNLMLQKAEIEATRT